MKLYLFIIICLISISCNEKQKKNFVSIKKQDMIVKGDITNDTIYNDTIYYYNNTYNLIKKEYYKNNKREGASTEYYTNGKPNIITFYSDGLKNGYNSYYDSMGNCFYKDFFYYDLIVGPIIYFEKNGTPKRFFFANLQNETLLYINYLDWHGVKDIYSNCINFSTNIQKNNSAKEVSILLYIINPPKFIFEYSILKTKTKSESDYKKTLSVKSELPFKNIVLPVLPEDEHYVIKADIFDSILNKRTIIYKDL